MTTKKLHWYMLNLNFLQDSNPIPKNHVVYLPMEEKYENINASLVKQFSMLGKEWLENNGHPHIMDIFTTSITYLGFMSNEEFYAE
ncbi:hypothetical protein XA39_13080 [Acinetobacter tandoii]|uniref:hypothetical protein n=1 Tax=Acinetobacter TaxID=469 RepID=UPI000C20AD06|nr:MULTISPECIES: hypothetical protein [Acinetobacter]NCI78545.1 hypothetical protein [Acinetobacter kanungonis]PJG42327.1 hypothetical protein XA39_13080 [Acinetobacter tandoii]